MILQMSCQHNSSTVWGWRSWGYHRLVKTTPKPRATKNSKGELVGPPPLPPPGGDVEAAGGAGGAVVEGDRAVVVDMFALSKEGQRGVIVIPIIALPSQMAKVIARAFNRLAPFVEQSLHGCRLKAR